MSLPEMAPRIFSFNSPHGACETCLGLGARREIDPALLIGDPSRAKAELGWFPRALRIGIAETVEYELRG